MGNFSSDSKIKFEPIVKENTKHFTSRYTDKDSLQNETKSGEPVEKNEISIREYNSLKLQMNVLLNKISVFEEEQKEIEKLRVEENELKENYTKLEQNYITLEQVNCQLIHLFF